MPREAGDWTCSSCGTNNFKRRTSCFSCRKSRYTGHTSPPTSKPGDWKCPSCQFSNFATRKVCFKCGTASPQEQDMKQQINDLLQQDTSKECQVCFDAVRNCVLVPCGHQVVCMQCADKLDQCPICRARKTSHVRVIVS